MTDNLYALIQERFPANAEQTVLETTTGRCYSYADLHRESGRYARFLTRLGLGKGDRVAVQVEKSPAALFFYLGCLRAGLIYLPLNTAYRREELDYFLSNAEPAAVLYAPDSNTLADLAAAHGIRHRYSLGPGGGSLTDACRTVAGDFTTLHCSADDKAAILYTSGTTSRPKGAMISHGNLATNGLTLVAAWGFDGDDVLLHALPLFHVHGLFVACHCVLLAGARMLFLPQPDVAEMLRLLPRATVLMGVPTFYTRLLNQADFGVDTCHNMRLFISGSAPLLAQTFREFETRTGHTILERYGMTETGMNTSNPLVGTRCAGTVGPPLPGVTARIVDDSGTEMGNGEVGRLEVKGANVFKGYWRMPEKTAEDFTNDGFFRTGDLASRDEQGYITITGRGKDLVISGGYNVYPKEVEQFIDAVDGIVESAVIGLAHPDFGEAVAAVIVRKPGREDLDETAVIASLKNTLATFKVPKRVFFVTELPRNSMGKVQKNVLRERYDATVQW